MAKIALSGGVTAIRDEQGVYVAHPSGSTKVVWQGVAELNGDPGERHGEVVRFEDLTGDGLPELVVGTVHEQVRLCGASELPLLFRRVYDPQTEALRSIASSRAVPFAVASTLRSKEGFGQAGGFLAVPEAVSSAPGAQVDLLSLVGPFALTDSDPSTMWVTASQDGRGEFATFRVPTGPYGIVRVGVMVPAGSNPRQTRKFDEPRSLLLVLSDRAYRLEFDSHPAGRSSQMVWFELPEPVVSPCASLVVESTFEQGIARPVAIAEVAIRTQADGDEAIPRLARDLSSKERRATAASILERRGETAAQAVLRVFDSLDASGRVAALRVLAATDPATAMRLFIEAALGSDEALRRAGLGGMEASPEAAMEELHRRLDSSTPTEAEAAVDLVEHLPAAFAVRALVLHAGTGHRRFRAALRSALGREASRSGEAAAILSFALSNAIGEGGAERAIDLLRSAANVTELRDVAVEKALQMSVSDASFATQYRLMEVAQALRCQGLVEAVRRAASHEDPAVRSRAVLAAATCASPQLVGEIGLSAIEDGDVAVRLAGWQVVSELPDGSLSSKTNLEELYRTEPWPAVRVWIARAMGPKTVGAQAVLTAAVADESPAVRVAALEALEAHAAPFADSLVLSRLSDGNESLLVRAAAARSAGRRCQASAAEGLFGLLRQGAEPLATRLEIEAAMAAATALGELGTAQARALLKKAARRSNSATDRAIGIALGASASPCSTSVIAPSP